MVESLAKLHCCGTHHHDTHKPAGVQFIIYIPELDTHLKVYGTGENEDSALIIVPSDGIYQYDDLHTQLFADSLARAANIAVIVPAEAAASKEISSPVQSNKRGNEDAFGDHKSGIQGTKEAYSALIQHLRQAMSVSFVGLLSLAKQEFSRELIDSAAVNSGSNLLDCDIQLSDCPSASTIDPESLTIMSSTVEFTSESDEIIVSENAKRRVLKVQCSKDHKYLKDPAKPHYDRTMKEIIYVLKKNLHDWS